MAKEPLIYQYLHDYNILITFENNSKDDDKIKIKPNMKLYSAIPENWLPLGILSDNIARFYNYNDPANSLIFFTSLNPATNETATKSKYIIPIALEFSNTTYQKKDDDEADIPKLKKKKILN